ncbi:MAG: TetR/AcrR family transcriptional regulator C-terminal domain-containing protein [Actinobacteria bacterium]|nr:TetR/AcrR family transcriptional regulator C-terminal domain-containing protein [Actinomycetota bacterium]
MAPDTATGRARPGAKARLDPAMIVSAGLEVAAASRSLQLSAKELGIRLDADPTSIYRHFRNKGHLMEALLDELNLRSVSAVDAPEENWQARLRQMAAATLDEYCRHPSVAAEAMVLTTHGPGEQAAVELMLDAFTRAGLPSHEVVRHYALFASHVLSLASGIARARAALPNSSSTDRTPWLEGPILADPRTHPRIAEFSAQLSDLEDRELFDLGIESVIQSAELIAAQQLELQP